MPFLTNQSEVEQADVSAAALEERTEGIYKSSEELETIVANFAATDAWWERVRFRTDGRWFERLYHDDLYDIWAISWMPGQGTGYHDHGGSAGAFVVATGALEEHRPGAQPVVLSEGATRAFGAEYAHDVRNIYSAPAVSIHAYSPPLGEMNEFELEGDKLVQRKDGDGQRERRAANRDADEDSSRLSGSLSIEQVLSTARSQLRRLTPSAAYLAAQSGGVLVDIRPEQQRRVEGEIPGALVVERNVLEWRFDPASSSRLPVADHHGLQVIVICSEGYTSSLAAAALKELGLWRATDVVGGFQAWRAAGLPVAALNQQVSS